MDPANVLKSKIKDELPDDLAALRSSSPEEDEVDEEDSADTLSPLPITMSARQSSKNSQYSPLSAESCFQQALEVDINGSTFRVYYSPPKANPSGSNGDNDDSEGALFVGHHGAGFGALSFACLAREITSRSNNRAGFLTFDVRGHGKTKLPTDTPPDYSLSTLTNDFVNVLKAIYPDHSKVPQLILVGHSMGGAVVTEACPIIQKEVGKVIGLCILDVVEGSAMEALPNMLGIIEARPKSFNTVEDAIAWHVGSNTIRNSISARISVPSLFKLQNENDTSSKYIWKTNLRDTQPFWKGWYTSLSSKFLSLRTAKLLILAGTDRLDKDLMIGQMQGKYQLIVIQEVGHCLHEDAPERLAESLVEFWRRNDQVDILKNVKKVGQV